MGGRTDAVRVMLGMLEVCRWPGGPVWLKTKVATDCTVSPCSEEERMSRMGYDDNCDLWLILTASFPRLLTTTTLQFSVK